MGEIKTSLKLYQMVEQKLREEGDETLPATLPAMEIYASEGRGDIDYLKFMNLDNESFLEAIYMCAFNAVPPREYIDLWQDDIETLPKEILQKKFLYSFVQRVDYGSKHIRLRNCFCINASDCEPKILRRTWIRQQIYLRFKPMYLCFPHGLKTFLKKHLWKYFFAN